MARAARDLFLRVATSDDPRNSPNVTLIRNNDGAPAAPQQGCLMQGSDPSMG